MMDSIDKEFPRLVSFLQGTYNQDVWTEFNSHREIWDDFIKFESKVDVVGIVEEIQKLSLQSSSEAFERFRPCLINNGLALDEASFLPFLSEFKIYLESGMR